MKTAQDSQREATKLAKALQAAMLSFHNVALETHNSLEDLNLDAVERGLDLYDALVPLMDALDDIGDEIAQFERANKAEV